MNSYWGNRRIDTDSPIDDPDDDLLGSNVYAESVARYLLRTPPNCTLGIYGEWGAGKTSFVKLVEYHLRLLIADKDKLDFITFDAWEFKTANELWRAMIIRIAKALYQDGVPAVPAPRSDEPDWRRILNSSPLALFWGKAADAPRLELDEILDQLDSTLYGGIAKSEGRYTLNAENALMAALNGVTVALAGVSPFVAGIRSLFKVEDKIDLAAIFEEKNKATREQIQSIDKFKELLTSIFEKKAKDKRVFVFIDDIDRCMPDVALDLLEAIRVFLGAIKCTFIVAADRALIGQGLKLRFKELLDTRGEASPDLFYERKGCEYFEKIIQFGLPVPEPTDKQAHDFITAYFPQWIAASDIIIQAVGANPRRLKQYCTMLDLKYEVCRIQPTRP